MVFHLVGQGNTDCVIVAQKVILCGDGVWVLGKDRGRRAGYLLGRFIDENGIGNRAISGEKFQLMGHNTAGPWRYPDIDRDQSSPNTLRAYEDLGYTCSVEWLSGSFEELMTSAEQLY